MWEKPLHITQAHLRVLAEAPHQFRERFLEEGGVPAVAAQTEAIARGKQFHQLMHQQALQLPVQDLVAGDRDLQRYFAAYERTPPAPMAEDWLAEYPLAIAMAGFQLYGVVDGLARGHERAQVVDWKTYARATSKQTLREDWQTRLYLFLTTASHQYAPNAVSMVYWFAEAPEQSVQVDYSEHAYARDRAEIADLLEHLNQWLEADSFPSEHPSPSETNTFAAIDSLPPLPLP